MTKKIAASIALLAVVILSSYYLFQHLSISWNEAPGASSASPGTTPSTLPSISKPGQGKIWVCPMHPQIMQDHPGTCPICGMDLVESKDHPNHDHGVQIDTASIQKLGVRLVSVKKSTLSREVLTYGNVTADGSAIYNVHSNFDGWIKKLHIHSVGQNIKQGQVIYEIYSPELIMQQKEYLRFAERRKQILQTIGDVRFQENEYVMDLLQELSRERTKFLYENIGVETVQQMDDYRRPVEVVKILAAESGVVTQINAREGSYATPSATLFTLANVSRVWIDVALYPDQAGQVKTGDEVTITSPGGQKIKARLDFLNPLAENNKASARVAIDNGKLHLRPGSFVDVAIHAQPHKALALPRSAVMRTGRGSFVMLYRGDGRFLPTEVETGVENGELVEISDGLQEDAQVAVNGQYLLDAAASLHDAMQRMQRPAPSAAKTNPSKHP
jgi:Cu(I)/Ag(I) efflux system membrane fusion protein